MPPYPWAGCAPLFLRGPLLRSILTPTQSPASTPPPTWLALWKAFLPVPQGPLPTLAGLARGPQPCPGELPFLRLPWHPPGIGRGSAALLRRESAGPWCDSVSALLGGGSRVGVFMPVTSLSSSVMWDQEASPWNGLSTVPGSEQMLHDGCFGSWLRTHNGGRAGSVSNTSLGQ